MRRWTKKDEMVLEKTYLEDMSTDIIAETLNRTQRSIESKLSLMGIKRGRKGYQTHYMCVKHGWFLKNKVKDFRCPICNSVVRASKRW